MFWRAVTEVAVRNRVMRVTGEMRMVVVILALRRVGCVLCAEGCC
jgi:hypothetical protein